MDLTNYYSKLNLNRKINYTNDEIKKAYKKEALKWHPDKWINYTEKEKKLAEDKFKELSEAYNILIDPNSYKNINRNFNSSYNFFQRTNFIKNINLFCSLEELYTGTTKVLNISNNVINLNIKPGWKEGTKITFNKYNIIIIITIKENIHKNYKRIDNDLLLNLNITQNQIDLGNAIKILLLDGTIYNLFLDNYDLNKKKIIIKSKGMPIQNTNKFGNLSILLNII